MFDRLLTAEGFVTTDSISLLVIGLSKLTIFKNLFFYDFFFCISVILVEMSLFFFFGPHHAVGSLFSSLTRDWTWLCPLQWKHGDLTTELPGRCWHFLFIWVLSLFFLLSLARGLSVFFSLSKNQLLVLLIFFYCFFQSLFISSLVFIISFLLLTLGFV